MDTQKLVEDVKQILCNVNREDNKYGTAWLSFEDDLTGRERYVLNVKAEHNITSCYNETRFLTSLLWEKLRPESLRMIARIAVHDNHDQIHCYSEDIPLLESSAAC